VQEGAAFRYAKRVRTILAASLLAAAVTDAALAQHSAELPPGSTRAEARVERVIVDAYVTDSRGNPVAGLSPADFRVLLDGQAAGIEAADWLSAETPEAPAPPDTASATATVQFAPGRLLILFFQTDLFVPARLQGALRMALQARRLLDTLLASDRVAVLSFDSHLKLRQDFTDDRAAIESAIDAAIRTGPEPPLRARASPSLARAFDPRAARKAVTPERALELISRAAEPIAGAKSLLFFGWGLGTIGGAAGPNIRDAKDWAAALPALAAARISIFTLDVTDADYHSLEGSLQQISDLTGGRYEKTHIFPTLAIDRVWRTISGHYVLVVVRPPRLPRGTHRIQVTLTHRKGEVLAREYYQD
jgi:VWFA-related protein